METVYKKIIETFEAHPEVFSDRELPNVRMIDIYQGQPENPEEFEVFCPAIFIDWLISPGANGESDKLTIDFHILQEPGVPTDNFTPTLEAGLEYMRMLKACKYLLNKLRATNSTPLQYAGEKPRTTPFFKYHVVSYTCSIDQYTDSVHRPATGVGTIDSIKITEGSQKATQVMEIDVFV